MIYEDKYHLTPEQGRFLAKKKWDENVYCGMKMENRAVTFPQTKTILEGVNVPNVRLDDIQAILNMRDAWRYVLDTMGEPVTMEYWCKLNEYIARNESLEWGKLRTGRVAISGTDYVPPGSHRSSRQRRADPYPDRRYPRHRAGLDGLCMGRTGAVLLGREQAHKSDPRQ